MTFGTHTTAAKLRRRVLKLKVSAFARRLDLASFAVKLENTNKLPRRVPAAVRLIIERNRNGR